MKFLSCDLLQEYKHNLLTDKLEFITPKEQRPFFRDLLNWMSFTMADDIMWS
jgi:hypothetical protein